MVEIGSLLGGRYRLLELLGQGGMATIYRGRDTQLGRDVAVKVLPLSASANPDVLRRFEQEARAAASLNHPNILAVFDVGTHDGVRFIVTPGSQAVYLQALREGLVETLIDAGAVVTNSTCGACLGYHMGVLAPGEVCITASPRNFKGRMGPASVQVYLASPWTVAASALRGRISDVREMLS